MFKAAQTALKGFKHIIMFLEFILRLLHKYLKTFKTSQNEIFEKSFRHTFLFHSIFKWHQLIHSKVPNGVVMDLKNVEHETNNKKILKKSFYRCQACFLLEHLLPRECYCPGIALSEHEAKLHFITLRAILPRPSSSENTTAPELLFVSMKRSFTFSLYGPLKHLSPSENTTAPGLPFVGMKRSFTFSLYERLNGQIYFKNAIPTARATNMSSSKLWAKLPRTGTWDRRSTVNLVTAEVAPRAAQQHQEISKTF